MFTFNGRCPHCNSDRGFQAFGISSHIIEKRDEEDLPLTKDEAIAKETYETLEQGQDSDVFNQAAFSLAGECLNCHKPIVATCVALKSHLSDCRQTLNVKNKTIDFAGKVKAIHPAPTPPYSHPDLPPKVKVAFIALQRMLAANLPPHFIIGGCRTVLEAAVRDLGGGKEGDTLHARIGDLYKKQVLTRVLYDWACLIKDYGNAAAHEMVGSSHEGEEIVDFTKIFLQYTYEFPRTIKDMRAKCNAAKAAMDKSD